MAKQLKSIKFPGLDEVYEISGGSGTIDIDLNGAEPGTGEGTVVGGGGISGGDATTLNGKTESQLSVAKAVDADKLGGITAEEYVKKTDSNINADTLGGYAAEEYVKKSEVEPGIDIVKNYSVVGSTTQPENPTENMIWIETNIEISNIIFSKNKPINPPESTIWVKIGESSQVAFYSTKINDIYLDEIYPLFAKQYVNGVFEDRVVKSFINNQWIDWEKYLYKSGNEYNDLTGSWIAAGRAWGSSNAGELPTVSRNSTNISFPGVAYRGSLIRPSNTIDITGYSTLEFDGILKDQYSFIQICSSLSGYISSDYVAQIKGPINGVCTLDLSSIPDGKYYICLATYHTGASITMNSLKLTS